MAANKRRPFAFGLPTEATLSPRKQACQERSKATVEAIHEAAFQVLSQLGYDQLTTTRVAKRAGVSVGTLYQYYPNKHALVRTLVLEYLREIEEALRTVLEQARDLPMLARYFVRRFISFKLERKLSGSALRTVFVLADAREALDAATKVLVDVLENRINEFHPDWRKGKSREVAMMWTSIVVGTTGEMLERFCESVAEPWFGEALETAVLAVLNSP